MGCEYTEIVGTKSLELKPGSFKKRKRKRKEKKRKGRRKINIA